MIEIPGAFATLVAGLIVVVSAAAGKWFTDAWTGLWTWLDARPPVVKQVSAVILTWAAFQFFGLLGYVPGFEDVREITTQDWVEIITLGLTFVFKGHAQTKALMERTGATTK